MTRQISITMSDFVFDTYLKDTNNRSQLIETLIMLGTAAQANEQKTHLKEVAMLQQQLSDLKSENERLKHQINGYKERTRDRRSNYTDEEQQRLAWTEAALNAGLLH